jgi:hypothetical protein
MRPAYRLIERLNPARMLVQQEAKVTGRFMSGRNRQEHNHSLHELIACVAPILPGEQRPA